MTFNDTRFDERFRVDSTDLAETRALLTPRFRQRYLDLAKQTRFTLPGSLASGNRFVLALPKRDTVNLFSPSSFWADDDRRNLMVLSRDIEAALTMADSVIELFA